MSKYNPPYGLLQQLCSGRESGRRMAKANRDYTSGFYRARGSRDGNRR